MRLVTVQVTADDIAKGERRNEEACPIALAMGRAGLPGAFVEPALGWFRVAGHGTLGNFPVTYGLPRRARAFGLSFDKGEPVQPFTFKVAVS